MFLHTFATIRDVAIRYHDVNVSPQDKSVIIATYALCGFANFGSIGITLGGLGGLAPARRSDLSQMVIRAMVCGNVACFLTACIAGKAPINIILPRPLLTITRRSKNASKLLNSIFANSLNKLL